MDNTFLLFAFVGTLTICCSDGRRRPGFGRLLSSRKRPNPGNVLNVRSGPGLDFTIIEQISEGTEFIQCTMSDDLEWIGIVLPDGRSDGCGLGDPIAESTVYQGDCISGWVHRSFTTLRQ